MAPWGHGPTVCSTFSSFLMRFKASYLLPGCLTACEQAFLPEPLCGQGAGKSTSAARNKAEMAFVLYTWGRGISMLMAAIGFRSLEMSPLQRLEGLCDCKAPGQVLQLFTAGWILPSLFKHLPCG